MHLHNCMHVCVQCRLSVLVSAVSPGGENGSEAAAGVCGVLWVQRAAAHPGHRLRGHKERWRTPDVCSDVDSETVGNDFPLFTCECIQAASRGRTPWRSCMRRMGWTRSCWSTPCPSSTRWANKETVTCASSGVAASWLHSTPHGCRLWRRCRIRTPSTTRWTAWRSKAWRRSPRGTWGGGAPTWTWLSSWTFMRLVSRSELAPRHRRLYPDGALHPPPQNTLRHEDGDDSQPPPAGRRDRQRASLGGGDKHPGLERRRSRRASLGRSGQASPCSPASPRAGFHPFSGHTVEDLSERWVQQQSLHMTSRGRWIWHTADCWSRSVWGFLPPEFRLILLVPHLPVKAALKLPGSSYKAAHSLHYCCTFTQNI